jgi:hypothetical protein
MPTSSLICREIVALLGRLVYGGSAMMIVGGALVAIVPAASGRLGGPARSGRRMSPLRGIGAAG